MEDACVLSRGTHARAFAVCVRSYPVPFYVPLVGSPLIRRIDMAVLLGMAVELLYFTILSG